MSTLTTNYGFIKPDFTEASGPEELAENMMKAERALINLEVGSSTGRQNLQRNGAFRNVSDAAVNLNTEGAFDDLTWSLTTDTSAWTKQYDVDGNWSTPTLGLTEFYNTGNFEVYHQGYYKLTWNLRLQASNDTMSEGFVRAALLGTDGYNSYGTDLGIIGSPMVVAMNTMTTLTDIGNELIIKVIQRERTDKDGLYNTLVSGKNQRDYWVNSPFYRYYTIAYAHNNTSSATMTVQATETYVHTEFVRGL